MLIFPFVSSGETSRENKIPLVMGGCRFYYWKSRAYFDEMNPQLQVSWDHQRLVSIHGILFNKLSSLQCCDFHWSRGSSGKFIINLAKIRSLNRKLDQRVKLNVFCTYTTVTLTSFDEFWFGVRTAIQNFLRTLMNGFRMVLIMFVMI